MVDRSELIPWLIAWVVTSAYVIKTQWKPNLPSAGLPFAYILTLSMIHFFGGLIYSFPWYSPHIEVYLVQSVTYANVAAGFLQSVYGLIAFGVGSTVGAEWFMRSFKPDWLQVHREHRHGVRPARNDPPFARARS